VTSTDQEKEVMFYQREGDRLHCLVCPQSCRIPEGATGLCRVRKHERGKLWAVNYGQVSSLHLDPIEKKPLYHFYPGSWILSVGTIGCNLACAFCQNWQISQGTVPTSFLSPQQAVEAARREPGNLGIAYTYNEPLMWYEWVYDTAPLVRAAGMKNVLVTNGFINERPLGELLPYIDAMNIDLKAMRPDFYRQVCRGRLEPVLAAIKQSVAAGVLVELTNLLIPGYNDGDEEIKSLVDWVAALSPALPLHFSRYHPDYRFDAPATPLETLQRAYRMARDKLQFVYLGNVMGVGGEDTACPSCGETVIRRRGMAVTSIHLREGRCPRCGNQLPVLTQEGE